MAITVLKSSGEVAQFDIDKLRRSLERSGASDKQIAHIIYQVNETLVDGISTKEIYKKAFSILKKESAGSAGRYNLRNAIMELGPTGYPFELFMGKLLAHQGYKVKVGEVVQGHSVSHEIDVWAERDQEVIMVECKYHSRADIKCDVKVPMYILSRYNDVKRTWQKTNNGLKELEVLIATNTQFSGDAIKFANDYGIKLLAWSYPDKGNLRERVDVSGLYPITCLTALSKKDKYDLLESGVVLVQELLENPARLDILRLDSRKRNLVLKNARALVG